MKSKEIMCWLTIVVCSTAAGAMTVKMSWIGCSYILAMCLKNLDAVSIFFDGSRLKMMSLESSRRFELCKVV